jgi:hypothetical protein
MLPVFWQFHDIFVMENFSSLKSNIIIDSGTNIGMSCACFAPTARFWHLNPTHDFP